MQNLILECAIRASLIAICTGAVLCILRVRAARVRHAAWASVVVLMLALPVWTAWGPRAVMRVFSPLGSMQSTERSAVSRLGMMAPTPLPERVGAMVRRWASPA